MADITSSSTLDSSTISGLIFGVTTGLSLTDDCTSNTTIGEIPRIRGETAVNRNHYPQSDPILLTLPEIRSDTNNITGSSTTGVRDLSHEFPGVHNVLRKMSSSILDIPPPDQSNRLLQTTPSLLIPPTTEPKCGLCAPLLKPQSSSSEPSLLMPNIHTHTAPTLISFVSPTQPASEPPPLSLPDIPMQQFTPHLIHPSVLSHNKDQPSLSSLPHVQQPPTLLACDHPLSKLKGDLKLLTFPKQPPPASAQLIDYKPQPVLLPDPMVAMDTASTGSSSSTGITPPSHPPIEQSLTGREYYKRRIIEINKSTDPRPLTPLHTPTLSSQHSNEPDESIHNTPCLSSIDPDSPRIATPSITPPIPCEPPLSDTIPTSSDTIPTSSDTIPMSNPLIPAITHQSVAIQVTSVADIGVQVGKDGDDPPLDDVISSTNAITLTAPAPHTKYEPVNDCVNDDRTQSEGSGDDVKGNESKVESISDEEWSSSPPTEDDNDDSVLNRFSYLEKQLQFIEDKASAMKEDFQNSRKVLESIDKMSDDNHTGLTEVNDGVKGNIISDNASTVNNTESESINGMVVMESSGCENVSKGENSKEDSLRQWMKKKRRERISEYKKERNKRIALERTPFTPKKQQQPNKQMVNTSDQSFPESKNFNQPRPRPSSDHSQRLSDAQTLLSDLLTPSPVALNNRNLPVSRSTLSNAMKTMTLSCTVPRNSSSHMTLGSSHVTSLDDTTRTRVDVQPRGQLKVNKRRLSSIECLSEAEQIKITEMLQKTAEDRIERESDTSIESSIDWSQIDQLLVNTT